MPTDEQSNTFGKAEGAYRLALNTVIRALVDQASRIDPGLRDRVRTDVDEYLARLDPQSALEIDFAERAKDFAAGLVKPPGL